MIDKSDMELKAVTEHAGGAFLCNFHALRALTQHLITEQCSKLRFYTAAINTMFKAVMRTTTDAQRIARFDAMKQELQSYAVLVPQSQIDAFINYLETRDFGVSSHWRQASTAARVFQLPEADRLNPLTNTNNPTERLHRSLQENVQRNLINKRPSEFLMNMLEEVFPRSEMRVGRTARNLACLEACACVARLIRQETRKNRRHLPSQRPSVLSW